jgi:hypothetical protein
MGKREKPLVDKVVDCCQFFSWLVQEYLSETHWLRPNTDAGGEFWNGPKSRALSHQIIFASTRKAKKLIPHRFGVISTKEVAMAQIVYSGNGSTGGSVPVDSNTYAPGDTITVANNTGDLSIGGEVFLYWNTAADGSGTIQTGGSTFTFTADVTFYAQWGVTTGLNGGGTTTHYQFYMTRSWLAREAPSPPEPTR